MSLVAAALWQCHLASSNPACALVLPCTHAGVLTAAEIADPNGLWGECNDCMYGCAGGAACMFDNKAGQLCVGLLHAKLCQCVQTHADRTRGDTTDASADDRAAAPVSSDHGDEDDDGELLHRA